MTASITLQLRALGAAAGTGLALASLSGNALAHGDHAAPAKPAGAQAQAQGQAQLPGAATAAAPSATSGQIIVLDPVTGQLRPPTATEAQALRSSASSSSARRASIGQQPLSRVHSSGAQGARLTDEFMSYSVLVTQPDGSVSTVCYDSKEAAEAAIKAAAIVKSKTAPTE